MNTSAEPAANDLEPWFERRSDARPALHFVAGGLSGGIVAWSSLTGSPGGLALGAGLAAVGLVALWQQHGVTGSAEGLTPRQRSWVARETVVGIGLLAAVAIVLLDPARDGATLARRGAGLLALLFIACQARLLNAAPDIPAWREPLIKPLLVAMALAEGAGAALLMLGAPAAASMAPATARTAAFTGLLGWGLVVVAALALLTGYGWHARLGVPRAARRTFARTGRLYNLLFGLAVGFAVVALGSPLPEAVAALALSAAGALALAGGVWFTWALTTQLAFGEGPAR